MGNQTSGGKRQKEAQSYGDIYVDLSQDNFVPGDTLTGTIYLNLKSPYPGDKLCLKMKGTEYTHWIDTEARQRTVARIRDVEGRAETYHETETYYVEVEREQEKTITKTTLTVYDWHYGTVLPPGQFSFPFSFRVSDGIPGSFFLHQGKTIAEIRYRLEAFLMPENKSHPKIKHKAEITIRENVKNQIETKNVTLAKKMKTCCCCDQGLVNVKTSFEKNAYAPLEQVRILSEIDNSKCSLNMQDVVFELVQTVLLKADGHSKHLTYTIRSLSLGTIQAGQTCLGGQQKTGSMLLPPGQAGAAKQFKKNKGEGSSNPAEVLTPSTHGSLVTSDFHLNVRCVMDGCTCCDTNPTTNLPIQIYAPLILRQPVPVAPMNWHPQAMPTVNLVINMAAPGQIASPNLQYAPQQDQSQMIMNDQSMVQNQALLNYNQQPGFVQPQQGYPQGYNQPQQAYGQPQFGYNQQQGHPEPVKNYV